MLEIGVGMETRCRALLTELQNIWSEVGEKELDRERMLSQIERECLEVYRKKIDEASKVRAQLHQSLSAAEAEIGALMASLGEHALIPKKDKRIMTLKEQVALITPVLENLRGKKEERVKQFSDVRSQIEKITVEITEYNNQYDAVVNPIIIDEHDLSTRKLNEYHVQLQSLQKEKSDRLKEVLEYINQVHSLCCLLGLDFGKTVDEVHPSLHETGAGKPTNISNDTLDGLAQTVLKLKEEKKTRIKKLRETMQLLFELWKLMDIPEEEKHHFRSVACILELPEQSITRKGFLSQETVEQTEAEVERLTKLKASRMKELVLKRRAELEELCRRAHIEPDTSTATEKTIALIDSGLVDPSELLTNIEAQIVKVKEESLSRKEIMDKINKWLAACDEEDWLEEYNQDNKRYSAGRGVHLNLKRAEKARILVTKIPAMLDNLISRTFAWEDARNMPFLYDGSRLISILEEYKLTRQQKDEEKRRFREQKKLQNLLLAEKSTPKRINSFDRKSNAYHVNGNGNGYMTPTRRSSLGSATPELLTPRSYSGRYNGYFKDVRRLSATSLNFVASAKEDSMSTFTSVSGSEPESPPLN